MNRRGLLAAAPAFGFAGLIAAGAVPAIAETETPISALFREWVRFRKDEEAVYAASPTGDDEQTQAITALAHRIERRIMNEPCISAEDFVMKVVVQTNYGDYTLPDEREDPGFWGEARQMIAA